MGTQLVGRATELTELLAATLDGAGAVLSGPTGVGKTALAGATAREVEAAGDRVEWVVATEASRSIPFGALAPLLPGDLDTLHPALVLGGIIRRQREIGGGRPPLVVVDDAHLLDDHSAATLLGLVTSGAGRVLATVRPGEVTPDAVRTLWKDGFLMRCEVGPFDRVATGQFLALLLGGDVAASTVSLLWRHTHGNALFLTEVARQARADHQLVDEHGVWLWRGDVTLPPRLADLLDRRFDGLDPVALDALGAVVLGEPISLDVLGELNCLEGIAELEARHIVEATERDGLVRYGFAHPMLAAAAARRITPAHRRRLADALVAAPGGGVDLVRRAMWQLDSSAEPDVDVLLASAGAVFLTQPALALRLAERAVPHDAGPRAALMMADARAELGDVPGARAAQAVAAGKVRTDADLLTVRLNQVSLTAFSDRRPDLAIDLLAAARVELPAEHHPDIDSMAAQITVFSARPADALVLADAVLAAAPPRRCRLRAASARVVALALVDRPTESLHAADALLADVAAGPASPYAQGVAHVAALLARFAYWKDQFAPVTEPSGRWPVPPAVGDLALQSDSVFYPLFDGGRRLMEGHVEAAIAPLREAVAQQRLGEGLLRSEAVALLVAALSAAGEIDEASELLAETPPDRVALFVGLGPWAASTVAAATGRPDAVSLAFEAYDQARAAGSPTSAVAYLNAAARFGAASRAVVVLDQWGHRFQSPISVARATAVRARANGDAKALLEAAERHAEIGLVGDALELADLAVAAFGRDRTGEVERTRALARAMRRQFPRRTPSAAPVIALTRRELEVAMLAAKGMSDRAIADVLVVSVRTVESHLAAAYRKLDISSRHGLRAALGEQRRDASRDG